MQKKGFSLIEVFASLGILVLMTVAIALIQRNIFSFGNLFQENLNAQNEAKAAFSQMTKDIRNASYASNGSYPIAAASTSSITFFSDVNMDSYKEQVRYYVDSNNKLRRGVIKPTTSTQPVTYSSPEVTTILVNRVSNTSTPIFSYYDANYNGIASSSALTYPLNIMDIRMIKIEIIIQATDKKKQTLTTIMTTHAMLRNLKDNL